MKKAKVWGLSFVLILCLTACGRDFFAKKIQEFVKDDHSNSSQVVVPPVLPIKPSEQVIALLPTSLPANLQNAVVPKVEENNANSQQEEVNAYIQCLNRTAERVKQSRDRYLSWVNEKSGPTCTERSITYGLYTLYNDGIETCQKAAQKGQAGSAMQKSATDLAAAYAELVPLVQKAEDYYTQQDYKDDHCEKAKQIHPQLLSIFGRYLQAQRSLEAEIDHIKVYLDQKELAQIEQTQGKKLAWHSKSFMISAEKLIKSFPKDDQAPFSNVNYLLDYPNVEKAYEALVQYSTANPQEGKDTFWYSSFESSTKDFYTKAKFLKRDLADAKKPDTRSMNDVIASYNRLVRDSNNTKFK